MSINISIEIIRRHFEGENIFIVFIRNHRKWQHNVLSFVNKSEYKLPDFLSCTNITKRFNRSSACFLMTLYGVAQKSKPLSLVIIKSYWNLPLWLHFSSIWTRKWAQENNKSVLNILCGTWFVTSSLAVFEAAVPVKSTHLIKSCLKIKKREKMWK